MYISISIMGKLKEKNGQEIRWDFGEKLRKNERA